MPVNMLKQRKIIDILLKSGTISSSVIHALYEKSGDTVSLVTIKRLLSAMVKEHWLVVTGSGPTTSYAVSVLGRIFAIIDSKAYCAEEPDKRFGKSGYDFNLFASLPTEFFFERELAVLNNATGEYRKRIIGASDALRKKELERLVIELSWKSSKIEGNTYTLLDTEKLILENEEAPGHGREEAQMILNHKKAFEFILAERRFFKSLTRANMEQLHSILVEGLGVDKGLRQKPVGVLGSKYRPLDNQHQLIEAVDALSLVITKAASPYAKALLALVGIGYIQPFDDGNKRTARLMANALLLAHDCAPLSYRSVDEREYREGMLVFYEVNSLAAMKKIFIEQYVFAAHNYSVN